MTGTVEERSGPLSYTVTTNEGVVRKHLDQMLSDDVRNNNDFNVESTTEQLVTDEPNI